MDFIKKAVETSGTKLCTLSNTTILTQDLIQTDSYWKELNELYQSNSKNNLLRAFTSIVNSTITQKRAVFIITRKSIKRLLSNDVNHASCLGFDNNAYSALIGTITQDFAKLLKIPDKGQPYIFEVIEPKTLIQLGLSEDEIKAQRNEALRFVIKPDISSDLETKKARNKESLDNSVPFHLV